MFSVDGDLFSFLLDAEIARLLPSFTAVHTKRSPHPLSTGEQVPLTLSRSQFFFPNTAFGLIRAANNCSRDQDPDTYG